MNKAHKILLAINIVVSMPIAAICAFVAFTAAVKGLWQAVPFALFPVLFFAWALASHIRLTKDPSLSSNTRLHLILFYAVMGGLVTLLMSYQGTRDGHRIQLFPFPLVLVAAAWFGIPALSLVRGFHGTQQARGVDGEPAAASTTPPENHPSRRLPL
jgi:hypothetical protein